MRDYEEFITRVVDGRSPAGSAAELRALLHWLAGRRNEAAVSIEAAFNARGIPSDSARRHTLCYLDNNLFLQGDDYYRLLGLTPDSTFSEIRARHKQLLQIFHPDRHTEDRDWFTERTEQLNQAYAYLNAQHGKTRSESAPAADANKKPAAATPEPRHVAFWKAGLLRTPAASKSGMRERLRTYLGSSARFERRLYIILGSIPALLLLFVYLYESQEAESQEHRSVADSSDDIGESGSPGPLKKSAVLPERPGVATPNSDDLHYSDVQTGHRAIQPAAMRDRVSGPSRDGNGQTATDDSVTNVSPPLALGRLSVQSLPDGAHQWKPSPSPPYTGKLHPRKLASVGLETASSEFALRSQTDKEKPKLQKDQVQGCCGATASEQRSVGWRYLDEEPNKSQRPQQSSSNQATRTPADSTGISDLIAVKKLLSRYQIAYNVSDVERLTRLFHPKAVTEYGKSKPEIEESYLRFFRRTSRRKLVIRDAQIERLGKRHFKVTAEYSATWALTNGKSDTENGLVRMQLVKLDDSVRIIRLNYVVQ